MLYIAALRQAGVILLVTCLTSFAVAAGSECLDYFKEPLYHPFAVPNSGFLN